MDSAEAQRRAERLRPERVSLSVKLQRTIRDVGRLPFRRLATLSWSQRGKIAAGTLFLLISSGAGLVYPQAVRWILDSAMSRASGDEIDSAALWMLAIFAVQGAATAARSYLFTLAGERIVANLRRALYDRLIDFEIGFFDQNRTGELMSRLSSDTQVLQNTVSVNVSMALRNVALLLGGLGFLAWTSLKLTLFMMLIVPPVALVAVYNGRRIRRYAKASQQALAEAGEVAEETLSGVRTVRRFSAEEHAKARYGTAVEASYAVARMRARFSSTFFGVTSFAGFAAVALVVWHGGHMVLDGHITAGGLTSFVLYTITVAVSLGALGGLWSDFMRAAGAADRVFELLDRADDLDDEGGSVPANVAGGVTFDDVSFSYPARPEVEVLSRLNITLKPGQVVALVGPSGGGKSTVGALMSRLYDPTSGAVMLDGADVKTLNAKWLRSQIGTVAQEPLLFSASIHDNILYGRPHASKAEVEQAAQAANAHGFVSEFPEGYDTLVGERGVRLSGGQKQRVAIARALLKDPPILVLDEATSALDAESEHLVKEALSRLMQGRTTLLIAHRLSTVRDADAVGVLQQGELVEWGTHDELMQQSGIYRRLVERQLLS